MPLKQHEELLRFVFAGTSCITSAAVTNPIDVIKIRMQLDNELSQTKGKVGDAIRNRYYKGFVRGAITIAKDEGVSGLYKGLAASMLRESIYSSIRLGAYEPMKRLLGAQDTAHTPIWKKICAGACSGALGSAIATPTDLVKVRLQAEGRLHPGEKSRYPSTFQAFQDIFRAEGIRGLYVGIGPTVKRATILTATQIPVYDHTKHTLINDGLMTEGVSLHMTASMIAGFMTAVTTSPVDVIKTRVMNQRGKAVYRGAIDCTIKTIKSEGVFGLYKGFIPNWMRIGPHTIVTFFIFEQLRHLAGMSPI